MLNPFLGINFGEKKLKESPQNSRYLVRLEGQVRWYGIKNRRHWGVEKVSQN